MNIEIVESKIQYESYKRKYGLAGINVLTQALIHKGQLTASQYDQHIMTRMEAGDNLKLFFLIDKGITIAAAMGWPFGTIQNGPRLHIQSLAVTESMRNKGFGITILEKIQHYCRLNGLKGFDLDVGTRSLLANSERYLKYGAAPTKTLFSIESEQKITSPTSAEKEKQNRAVQAIVTSFQSSASALKFNHKKVLVTGGSSGIGQAVAIAFAKQGANVVFTYNTNHNGAKDTIERIRAIGGTHACIQIDFSDVTEEKMLSLIVKASKLLGGLDILINNAGAMCRKSFLDVNESDYTQLLTTNLKAPWFLTKAFAKMNIAEKVSDSCIVNISSISDRLALDNLALYQMTKAALSMQTQSAALSLAKYGVRVNAVCPGLVATKLNERLRAEQPEQWEMRSEKIPLGAGKPEDIADMVLFLSSSEASWITGKSYTVDGGQTGSLYTKPHSGFFNPKNDPETDSFLPVRAKL